MLSVIVMCKLNWNTMTTQPRACLICPFLGGQQAELEIINEKYLEATGSNWYCQVWLRKANKANQSGLTHFK